MKTRTLWMVKTAVLLALLIVLQAVTKGFGQFVTGSCVNAVLALAALTTGLSGGILIAALSPFLAFVLGIGPQLLPLIPAIAVGNLVFVFLMWALTRGHKKGLPWSLLAWGIPAVCKFLTLYLLVVQLLCRILPLNEVQTKTFSAMFSWPQLVTALIGSAIALVVAPALPKNEEGVGLRGK